MSTDVFRRYKARIQLDFKTVTTTKMVTTLDQGFTGIEYTWNGNTFPVIEDKYLPYGQVLLIDTDMIGELELF